MCVVLQGIACSGFTVFAQLWCTEKKGPVFVTMFNPLSTIMVAILAYFIFGENLYVGRYVSQDEYACRPERTYAGSASFLYHIHTR
jgi:drug/metabolite transporter (DMT)-like permease